MLFIQRTDIAKCLKASITKEDVDEIEGARVGMAVRVIGHCRGHNN